jgi:hypothetical protein
MGGTSKIGSYNAVGSESTPSLDSEGAWNA